MTARNGYLQNGCLLSLTFIAMAFQARGAVAQMPPAIAAPGETTIAALQGEGAQIYECKAGGDSKLIWAFREPIASLILDGKTVGRHFAGPTWENVDGSAVTGKAVGNAPGVSANDIPWLKLDIVSKRGSGTFADVATVQRIDTHGGVAKGSCDHAGAFLSVPYSAEYVFLRKGG